MAILKMDDLEVAPLSRWVSALLPRSAAKQDLGMALSKNAVKDAEYVQVAGSGLPSKTTRDQLHAKMTITSNYFITENDNCMNF